MAGYHKTKLGPDKQNDEGSKMSKKSTVNHAPGLRRIVDKLNSVSLHIGKNKKRRNQQEHRYVQQVFLALQILLLLCLQLDSFFRQLPKNHDTSDDPEPRSPNDQEDDSKEKEEDVFS